MSTGGERIRLNDDGRAGFTIAELTVVVAVGVILFLGWLRICNFQAIRLESFRRAALEEAAGYLDVMAMGNPQLGNYSVVFAEGTYYAAKVTDTRPLPMFDEDEPIGYRLYVTNSAMSGWESWRSPDFIGTDYGRRWAVIDLFDRHGIPDAGRPFSRLALYIVGSDTP